MLLEVAFRPYAEYSPESWVVQPWNTLSSLSFFIPVLYWLFQLRGAYRTYPILTAILPLIALNGLGSTLFHGNNGGTLFLLLDVLPPFIMMLTLSLYFWKRVTTHWSKAISIILLFIVLNLLNRWYLWSIHEYALSINLFYVVNGIMVLTPLLFVLYKNHWIGWKYLIYTVVLIATALLFRYIDQPGQIGSELFSQGTHFLWHLFSAAAVFPLGQFLIVLRKHPDN